MTSPEFNSHSLPDLDNRPRSARTSISTPLLPRSTGGPTSKTYLGIGGTTSGPAWLIARPL